MTSDEAARLIALADACEKAEGRSVELDRQVLLAMGGKKRDDDWWLGFAYIGRVIPACTASLDAAMALVPEGQDVAMYWHNGCAYAGCAPSDPDIRTADTDDAMAATPALALTAAALRARASMQAPRP